MMRLSKENNTGAECFLNDPVSLSEEENYHLDDDAVWDKILEQQKHQEALLSSNSISLVNKVGELNLNEEKREDNDYQYEEFDDNDEYFDEDELDYHEDIGRDLQKKKVAGAFSINQSTNVKTFQPQSKVANKYDQKIHLEQFQGMKFGGNVTNKVADNEKKENSSRYRIKDKSDRATFEQALDMNTMIILRDFLKQGYVDQIDGCFSTGKEANVYYAVDKDKKEYAIKIYKTSILQFKNRSKYIAGDARLRNSYDGSNPRKLIDTWSKKEYINYRKLHLNEAIRVPKPIRLKHNVLLMEFIGHNRNPAVRLKDANISISKARELYLDLVIIMWTMYNECKLVHADLSEYNILYHEGSLCIIDVSQSVSLEQENSLEFLKSDCKNITYFFRKKGVPTMTIKELFDFIVDPNITLRNRECHLDVLSAVAAERDPNNLSQEDNTNEQSFLNAFIPKSLDEVVAFERDLIDLKLGNKKAQDIYYTSILGLKSDLSGAKQIEMEEESDEEIDEDPENDEKRGDRRPPGRSKDETTEERKERKKATKGAQAVKRSTKMKKHDKKRLVKASKKN